MTSVVICTLDTVMNILRFFYYGCTAMWHTCVHAQSSTAGGPQPVWNLQDRNKWPIPSIKLLSIVCDGKNGPCWRERKWWATFTAFIFMARSILRTSTLQLKPLGVSAVWMLDWNLLEPESLPARPTFSCCSWMLSKKLKWVQAISNECWSKVYLCRILKISILLGWTEEKIYFLYIF